MRDYSDADKAVLMMKLGDILARHQLRLKVHYAGRSKEYIAELSRGEVAVYGDGDSFAEAIEDAITSVPRHFTDGKTEAKT